MNRLFSSTLPSYPSTSSTPERRPLSRVLLLTSALFLCACACLCLIALPFGSSSMSRVDNDSESLRPQLAVTIFASPDVAQTFPSPNQQTTRDTPGLLPIPTQVIQDRDAEQNRYLLRVALLLDRYQRVFKRLQELATQASTSSMLLFDPSWKKQMKDVGEEIQQIGREIRALTPPKHLESLHLDLISASRHFDFAMERMLYGIENFNVDAIQEGITSMYTGIEHIDRANRKIEALKQ